MATLKQRLAKAKRTKEKLEAKAADQKALKDTLAKIKALRKK